jgi:hypothetical protein
VFKPDYLLLVVQLSSSVLQVRSLNTLGNGLSNVSFLAIIAGVPINVPSRQQPVQPSQEASAGDNAWLIVATAMVMALTPALAFLYGTLNGSNISELVRNVTIVGSMITFLWILFT